MRAPTKLPAGLPPRLLQAQRCLVMGVVNVTPDSFSDGGLAATHESAVRHGLALAAEGADLVDVGGESTRPGAERVSVEEELHRVVPVVRDLAAAGVVVSVDTMRATVAEAALDVGAALINDVSGGLGDEGMLRFAAEAQVPYVLMHWRGHSTEMARLAKYDDVVAEVRDELAKRLDAAAGAGVDLDRIVLDPGLGFAKTGAQGWALLADLDALHELGRPLLVGPSRKSALGELLAGPDGAPRPVDQREDATVAAATLAAAAGTWCVRVHEPRRAADAVRVVAAVAGARPVRAEAGAKVRRATFGLGGNLGDRQRALQLAVDGLTATPGITAVAVSPVYETDAVGGVEQPDYLNAVLVVETDLPARALLQRALAVEAAHGRDRTREQRWGPRTLDIDLLSVGEEVLDEPGLTLPHPRLQDRAFVLAPWAEVDADFAVAGRGTVKELLAGTDAAGVRRRDDLSLQLAGS